jgi:hypothetical protein
MDDQLPFFFGAQQIERSLAISPGASQAKLRELCKSGEVRSWREPYSMQGGEPQGEGPRERIEPSLWRQREIDLMTDSDGCKFFVSVSKTDLDDWLDNNRKKAVGKRPLVRELLAAMYPDGVPDPPFCVRKTLVADLRKCDRRLRSLDEDTLKKAIEEYNADRKRS